MTEAEIKALYDSFPKKDMPFAKFRQELIDVQDPDKMMDDLGVIEVQRARERLNRMRIDKRLS